MLSQKSLYFLFGMTIIQKLNFVGFSKTIQNFRGYFIKKIFADNSDAVDDTTDLKVGDHVVIRGNEVESEIFGVGVNDCKNRQIKIPRRKYCQRLSVFKRQTENIKY